MTSPTRSRRTSNAPNVAKPSQEPRVPHAVQRAAVHRRCATPVSSLANDRGPGSAARHLVLRCARDTEPSPEPGRMTLLILVFIAILVAGVPVFIALAGSSLLYTHFIAGIPDFVILHRMAGGIDSFPLLAVPFFILAGNLMKTRLGSRTASTISPSRSPAGRA